MAKTNRRRREPISKCGREEVGVDADERLTFEGVGGAGRLVLVRMELKGEFLVGFLEVAIRGRLWHAKDLVKVLTVLDPFAKRVVDAVSK